jgi:hypothetical protein
LGLEDSKRYLVPGCLAQTEMETPEFKKLFFLVFSKRAAGALENAIEKKDF